ncbi:MAG: YihY/virulence factor BrkB family protein [Candidatus Eisenbacteria bacterium]
MRNPFKLLGRTHQAFGDHHCVQLAAAITYHVLFSFIPLITILLAVLGFILRDPTQRQIAVDRVLASLPLQSGTLIDDSIRNISNQPGTLTVIGLLGLLWTASGLFGAVRVALDIAWNVKTGRGFIFDKLFDLGAVLGLGILLTASLVGTVMVHFAQTMSANQTGPLMTGPMQTLFTVLGLAIPAVFSFVAFLLLYRYIPNVRHDMGDVWPGALVAMLLFEVGKHGFASYVSHFNSYQTLYGALGAVMLFMLWTHISAIIMLLGAELAAQHEAARRGRYLERRASSLAQQVPEMTGR